MTIRTSAQFVMLNYIVNAIPSWTVRRLLYRMYGMRIGRASRIMMKTVVLAPEGIIIGQRSIVNEDCILDGRGGLLIGDDVSISMRAAILSASHSKSSEVFEYRTGKVTVGDNVWIGVGAIVLDRSTLQEGVVLGAGSVTKGVCEANTVYQGNPASIRGPRGLERKYRLEWRPHFR